MNTEEKVNILSTLCTRDEAGRHFSQLHDADELDVLEAEGLIEIHRPIHGPTGIPYGLEHHTVEIMEAGHDLVDTYPEYHAA